MTEKEIIKQLKTRLGLKDVHISEQTLKSIIVTYKDLLESNSIEVTEKVEEKHRLSKRLFTSVLKDEVGDGNDKYIYDVAMSFYDRIYNNLTNLGVSTRTLEKNTYKSWVDPIRLMIVKDEISATELREVWKFLDDHEFWSSNIQCTKTLRKQFSKLHAQMKSNGKRKETKSRNSISDGLLGEHLNNLQSH